MLSPQSLLWGDTLNTLICRSAQRRLLQDRLPPTGSLIRDSLSTGSLIRDSLSTGSLTQAPSAQAPSHRLPQHRLPHTGSLIRDSLSTGSLSAGSLMPFSLFVLNQPVWDRFIALMSITYWDAYSWRLTEKRRS